MALVAALHQRPAGRCPAADPQLGPVLVRQLSLEKAPGHGAAIQAGAVVTDAHALCLVVEADSRDRVGGFLAPFGQAGTVEVLLASPGEAVIGRGAARARRRSRAPRCRFDSAPGQRLGGAGQPCWRLAPGKARDRAGARVCGGWHA